MAEKIEKTFTARVDLLPSTGGVFEIVVDDRLVHSKKTSGVFPDEAALLEQLRHRPQEPH
ncbi:MAG: Rdx family protein [Pelovirga sp.]